MSSSAIKLLLTVGLLMASASIPVIADESLVLDQGFQVCMRNVPGLTINSRFGIDAINGEMILYNARISFMVSRHPNLPAAMNLKPNKESVIGRDLSERMALVAESSGPLQMGARGQPIGSGAERLYAFNRATLMSPDGPPQQDQVFVQLWSDEHQQDVSLLKKVGGALYRCQ
jgi:hypothetical protein